MSLFPVETQHNKTLGWPPFERATFPRLATALCALRERYTVAGLVLPVLTFRALTTTNDPQTWTDLGDAASKDGTTEELSTLLQQIHTAVIGLSGAYVRPDFTPWITADFTTLGLKSSGAQWTADMAAVISVLSELQFRAVVPFRTVPFDFDFAGFGTRDDEPYAGWASPFKANDGKQVVGWRVNTTSTSVYGEYSIRYADGALAHAPARLVITPEGRAKGSTFGYPQCEADPVFDGESGTAVAPAVRTQHVSVSFSSHMRYFVAAGLLGQPWFVSDPWTLNGTTLPAGAPGLYEVTDLVVNGANTFQISYNGAYGWSDIYLVQVAVLSVQSFPPPAFNFAGVCYSLTYTVNPVTGDLTPFTPSWADIGTMKMDCVVQQTFTCLPGTYQPIERPHVIATASIASPGMLVTCETSPPPNMASYTVHLVDALADIDPLEPVFANVANGSVVYPVTQFQFVVPPSPSWTYYIVVVFTPTEDPPRTRVGIVGDMGYGDLPSINAVEDLIKANADDVILAGDNNYSQGLQSTIDSNVGRHWRKFIFPWLGDSGIAPLKPGEVDATENHCWAIPGNHDWANSNSQGLHPDALDPHLAYFTLPGNERYYQKDFGPVALFFLDSDINEPDGRTITSVQHAWLEAAVAASTAPIKGVVFHHPTYSWGAAHLPTEEMRWDFAAMGIQFAIQGHNHNYERWEGDDGVTYFTVGTGGPELDGFRANPPANSVLRIEVNGALFLEANERSCLLRFRDITGAVRDSKEFFLEGGPLTTTTLTTPLQVINSGVSWPCYVYNDEAPLGGENL